MSTTSKRLGFTVVELLVAVMVSTILISVTVAVYSAFRKTIAADQRAAALSQNARVALDRMSRELRQTPEIVTIVPTNSSDMSVSQPGELQFEDGHANDVTYKRYYVSSGYLKMDTIEYYFSNATSTRVHWDSVGTGGATKVKRVISTQDIAESVLNLKFYGGKPMEMVVTTSDGTQEVVLRTKIYERNI